MPNKRWIENANCRSAHPDIFFPTYRAKRITIARARGICMRCPVIQECARFVLREEIKNGVFAGVLLGYGSDVCPTAIAELEKIAGMDTNGSRD